MSWSFGEFVQFLFLVPTIFIFIYLKWLLLLFTINSNSKLYICGHIPFSYQWSENSTGDSELHHSVTLTLRTASFILPNGPSLYLLLHRWTLRYPNGSAKGRWFKRISITENCLARINHNKNGTCGLSSLKDRYLGTQLKPSYAPVKQRRCERAWRGFLCQRERFWKRLQFTF